MSSVSYSPTTVHRNIEWTSVWRCYGPISSSSFHLRFSFKDIKSFAKVLSSLFNIHLAASCDFDWLSFPLKIFSRTVSNVHVCGKFPETFILENIFNMSLCLNDSLAEYSILESKYFFFFFKTFWQFLCFSGTRLAPSPFLSTRVPVSHVERVLGHNALEGFYNGENK